MLLYTLVGVFIVNDGLTKRPICLLVFECFVLRGSRYLPYKRENIFLIDLLVIAESIFPEYV